MQSFGCELGQGYLLGPPVEAEVFGREYLDDMNHYVYPPRGGENPSRFSNTTFSGDICMDGLLEAMLQAGACREFLRAKAFGGGKMFEFEDALSVGKRNSSYAKYWLANLGIPLDLCDFHGTYARKLIFHPSTGQHLCQRVPTSFSAPA